MDASSNGSPALPAKVTTMIRIATGMNPWYEIDIGWVIKFQKSNHKYQNKQQILK